MLRDVASGSRAPASCDRSDIFCSQVLSDFFNASAMSLASFLSCARGNMMAELEVT